jgi:hypothetical protein
MNKFIYFKDIFFNLQYIIEIIVKQDRIIFVQTNGINREFHINKHYDESEKNQLLENLQSLI